MPDPTLQDSVQTGASASATSLSPRPVARRGTWAIVLLVLVAGALTVYFLFPINSLYTNDAQVDGHLMVISPKISGNVVRVMIDDNSEVQEGQLLAEIDPRDYQVRVDQLRAAYKAAIAKVDASRLTVPFTKKSSSNVTSGAQAQVLADQASLKQAQLVYQQASKAQIELQTAVVEAALATYQRAKKDVERTRPLVAENEVSKQQFDALVAAERVAENQWIAERQRLESDRQQADAAAASVEAAQARVFRSEASVRENTAREIQGAISQANYEGSVAAVEQAKADLEQALLQLSYTKLLAPFHGTVTRKSIELGQVLSPGQSVLTLVPLDQVWVVANYKETQLGRIRKGQRAEIRVDTYDGATVWGIVDSIASTTGSRQALLPPENATGNFVKVVQRIPVKIRVDSQNGGGLVLRPGMNVEVKIHAD